MESKSNNAVQSILSGAIEATAAVAASGGLGLADAQRRYGGSCHSLASVSSNGERRSRGAIQYT